jgi:hypothetical protein
MTDTETTVTYRNQPVLIFILYILLFFFLCILEMLYTAKNPSNTIKISHANFPIGQYNNNNFFQMTLSDLFKALLGADQV